MSQQSIPLLSLTVTATAAVTGGRFVSYAGAHTAAGAAAIGVSRYDAAVGASFPADAIGTAILEAGGAIAVGGAIESDANGKGVALASGIKLARALQSATASGQYIEVLLVGN